MKDGELQLHMALFGSYVCTYPLEDNRAQCFTSALAHTKEAALQAWSAAAMHNSRERSGMHPGAFYA